jgi:hypothetical protein
VSKRLLNLKQVRMVDMAIISKKSVNTPVSFMNTLRKVIFMTHIIMITRIVARRIHTITTTMHTATTTINTITTMHMHTHMVIRTVTSLQNNAH